MKLGIIFWALLLAFAASLNAVCVTPYENYKVNVTTTLCTGTYYLNDTDANGAIIINNNTLILDCNGSTFIGNLTTNSEAIDIHHFSNVTIKNCRINGGYTDGILTRGDNNNSFINNTFTGTYTINVGLMYIQRDFGYYLINNTFNNSNSVVIWSDHSAGNGNLTISGNYFHNVTASGAIRIDDYLPNLTLVNNTFDNTTSAFQLGTQLLDNALIENNTFIGTEQTFIQGANIKYKNNRHYNGSAIVHVGNSSSQNFTATGNYFQNIFYSTCAGGSDRCEAIEVLNTSNSLFANNTFVNVSDSMYATGIEVYGSNILITNNTFTAVSAAAHTTGSFASCTFRSSNVTFSFNTVNMTDAGAGYSHGLALWCTNNSQSYNNTAYNGRFMLLFEYETYNSSIHDNNVTNGTFPIYDLHKNHDNSAYNNYIFQVAVNNPNGAITMYDNITNERFWNNTFAGSGTVQYALQTNFNFSGTNIVTNVTNISIEHNQAIGLNISVDNLTNPNGGTNLSFTFTGNTSSMQIIYSNQVPLDYVRVLWNYSGQKSFSFDNQTINFTNLQSPYNDIQNFTSGNTKTNLIAADAANYSMPLNFNETWKAYVGDYYDRPTVTLLSPLTGTSNLTTSYNFSCNVSAYPTIMNTTLYVWNSTGLWYNNSTASAAGYNTSYTFNYSASGMPVENYSWNCKATDNMSNSSWAAANYTLNVTAPDSTPPTVSLISPATGTSSANTSYNFTCNASDNNIVMNATFYLWNSTALYYNNSTSSSLGYGNGTWLNFSVTGMPVESYKWNCLAYDNNSNSNWSAANYTLNVTSPNTPPVVTLVTPLNNSNTSTASQNFTFNYTASALSTANCTLYVGGTAVGTNASTQNGTNAAIQYTLPSNGTYAWYVFCANASNVSFNGTSGTNYITLDQSSISISLSSPGAYSNTTNPMFNWTATSLYTSAITCNLTIDTTVNQSNKAVTNATPYNITASSAFSNGLHNWSVSCWNVLNSTTTTALQSLTIDTSAPAYGTSNVTPANSSNYSYGQVYVFNISWTDVGLAGISSTWMRFDGANYSANTSSGSTYYYNVTGLVATNHTYQFFANDSAGNQNSTAALIYNITKAAPNLSVTSSSGWNITYLQNTTLTGACPASGANTALCKLYVNGTNISNPSTLLMNFSAGDYTVTLNTSTDENYSAANVTYSFNISKVTMPLTLTIDGAAYNKTVVNGTEVNVTATRGYAQGSIKIYRNGTLAAQNLSASATFATNMSNYSAGVYTFNLTYNSNAASENFIAASNITLVLTVLSSNITENQTIANNVTENVTGNTTQIVVPAGTPLQNVTIDPSVADNSTVSLNFTLIAASNGTVDVPNSLNLSRGTAFILQLDNGTTISNGSLWNDLFDLPAIMPNGSVSIPTASGYDAPVTVSVIEIGSNNTTLTLDHAARITFSGQAANLVGYTVSGGVFTPITTICNSATDQATEDSQLTGSVTDCKTTSGSDLIVWTRHLTLFSTYTQAASQPTTPSGPSYSGGGTPAIYRPVVQPQPNGSSNATNGTIPQVPAQNVTGNASTPSNGSIAIPPAPRQNATPSPQPGTIIPIPEIPEPTTSDKAVISGAAIIAAAIGVLVIAAIAYFLVFRRKKKGL